MFNTTLSGAETRRQSRGTFNLFNLWFFIGSRFPSLCDGSQWRRGASAYLPRAGRRGPGALPPGAQPGGQQPRLPPPALRPPDAHLEVRRLPGLRRPRNGSPSPACSALITPGDQRLRVSGEQNDCHSFCRKMCFYIEFHKLKNVDHIKNMDRVQYSGVQAWGLPYFVFLVLCKASCDSFL